MKKKSAALGSRRTLRVFLCHASEDKQKVAVIRNRLRDEGDDPWLDEEQLKGGEDWEQEIKSALRASDCVVIFLSRRSTEKRGFYQKEIRWAIEIALEQPDGHHFIIPAMLEECSIPNHLVKYHAVDISGERGYRLVNALNKRRQQVLPRGKTDPQLPPRPFRAKESRTRLSEAEVSKSSIRDPGFAERKTPEAGRPIGVGPGYDGKKHAMSRRRRVFLAYSSADEAKVQKLYNRLREDGFEPWMSAQRRTAGNPWPTQIAEQIRLCDLFVACLSGESTRKSSYVRVEITDAVTVLTPKGSGLIIPALLEALTEDEIPVEIRQFNRADFSRNWDEGYQQLLEALRKGRPFSRKKPRKEEVNPIPTVSGISAPGVPVPVTAANYIKRQADHDAFEAFQSPSLPFTMLVRGPVQCGKSTLLARLEQKARQLGVETAWFDPKLAVDSKQQQDINAKALLILAQQLQAQWGFEIPRELEMDSIPRFYHWLVRVLAPTAVKQRLLILDDLASLGILVVEDWLSLLVRAIHNQRAILGLNLSIAVGYTYHFGSDFIRKSLECSSIVHWWPKIELEWLGQSEVEELEHCVGGWKGRDLYALVGGQPYLTHVAATDANFREVVQDWVNYESKENARKVTEAEGFKHHLKAIKSAILGPTREVNAETRKLIGSFVGACQGEPLVNQDHRRFLETAHLLRPSGKPALEIYRLLIDDFQILLEE